MVALIGSETPSRLQAMLARQPSAYLMKPIRSTGIYASLAIATHQYATLQAMRRKLASAEERLRSRRLLLAAMLQIMNQAQVGEAEPFDPAARGDVQPPDRRGGQRADPGRRLSSATIACRVAPAVLLKEQQAALLRRLGEGTDKIALADFIVSGFEAKSVRRSVLRSRESLAGSRGLN